jgi:hypothetical protein
MHTNHVARVFSDMVSTIGHEIPDKLVIFVFVMTVTAGRPLVASAALQFGAPPIMLTT